MAYSSYSKILGVSKLHSDPAQYYKDSLQNVIDDRFERASDYREVDLLDRESLVGTTIGVRVVKINSADRDNDISDDHYKILFKNFDNDVQLGDLFEFDDYRWLVTDVSKVRTETLTCVIKRCNAKLKFIESNNDVVPTITDTVLSIDCIIDKSMYSAEDDRYYSIPIESVVVKLPNNSSGRKIRFQHNKGTRFLLGNPAMAYSTVGIDSLSLSRTNISGSNSDNGILVLRLKIEAINNRTDNVDEMVAKQLCYGTVS
jgi:hypothetical protein